MYNSFKKSVLIILSAIASAMLVLACAFMLAPKTTANADTEETHDHSTMTKLTACPEGGELTAGEYYLGGNISGNITIKGTVTLCLNGHNITGVEGGGSVINVSSNASFTLCDCVGTGCIMGGNAYGGGGGVYVDGTFTMTGGTISNNGANIGGGVYVALFAEFTMTGGTISNNGANIGGGVYTSRGAFTLAGGTISDNTGGGVYVMGWNDDGFKMTGGTISGNTADAGGGVCIVDGNFIMAGGTINDNTASSYAGGVYVGNYYGVFKLSGAPIISDNISGSIEDGTESNVYLYTDKKITITGELTEGAQIGVTLADGSSGAFTEGYGENNKDASNNIIAPDKYFVSDKDGYFLTLENGEVNLYERVATVTVDGVETEYGSIEDAWTYANGATTAATVKMYADAETTATLTVASGKNITLDLNGHMLKYTGSGYNSVITVSGTFTLCDGVGTGTVTGGTGKGGYGGGVYVAENGNFTMTGGTIAGNDACFDGYGGGVYVNANGNFTMTGGSISGNTAMYDGGVCIDGGTFTMENGTISGNTATYSGGGAVSNGGTFTMTGGKISGNTTTADVGGISVGTDCTFTMTGGEISGNTTAVYIGGVFINENATFEISGAPIITGNLSGSLEDGTESNVFLSVSKITLVGELAEGAQIGINNTGAVATGYTQDDEPSKYFIPDAPATNCVYLSGESNDTVNIGAHDWDDGEVTTQPTCTDDGVKTFTCTRCGAIKTEPVDKIAHTLTHNEATAATEDKEGNKEYWSCDECDKYFSDEAGETEITDKTSVILSKLVPAHTQEKSYWWLLLLLIPIAIGVGGVLLGIYDYKKQNESKQ